MASQLRVDNILPSVGTNVAIGTAGGSITLTGTVSGSSNINVGTGASISSPATNVLTLGTNNAERVRIDSSGRVGVGTDNPGAPLDIVTNSSAEGIRVRGRSSDSIGSLYFYNHTSATPYGLVQGRSTDFRLGSESNTPVIFNVNGSEVARFNTSGNLAFPSGQGIDFSATANSSGTMTSELLDDYEEGTFTPKLSFGGSTTGVTYQDNYGAYTKIGRLVTCYGYISLSNNGTGTGSVLLYDLPFTAAADNITNTSLEGGGHFTFQSGVSGTVYGPIQLLIFQGQSYAGLYAATTTAGNMGGLDDTYITNSFDSRFVLWYYT